MAGLATEARSALEAMFGPRSSFDATERLLYGHDIGALPRLMAPLVGRTTPEGIVTIRVRVRAAGGRLHQILVIPRVNLPILVRRQVALRVVRDSGAGDFMNGIVCASLKKSVLRIVIPIAFLTQIPGL